MKCATGLSRLVSTSPASLLSKAFLMEQSQLLALDESSSRSPRSDLDLLAPQAHDWYEPINQLPTLAR